MQRYQGLAASPGIAIGPAWVYHPARTTVEHHRVADPAAEWSRLQTAIALARRQLELLEARARATVGPDEAAIFSAHQMFLDDASLEDDLRQNIVDEAWNAESAVHKGFEHYAQALESLEGDYFKARAADVRDVAARVLRCLKGGDDDGAQLVKPAIVVAEDLTPSDTIQFDRASILGICTARGGPTSHTAILSRGLGVPAVVSVPIQVDKVENDLLVIIDGTAGTVTFGPTLAELHAAKERQTRWLAERDTQLAATMRPATTADGHTFEIVANIGSADEAQVAIEHGAEGVGLFRTEFLYLDRDNLPGEAEQVGTYRRAFEVMGRRPVVVRTLDIGGDKAVSYLGLKEEPNPFLGWRAIRMIRERPDVLESQFRALLLAGGQTSVDLRIMLPMVSSISEVRRAREIFDAACRELRAGTGPLPERVQFGIMVEVPSAALMAHHLAREVDFFSIGTNDLTQYTLAIDRTNERVAALASPYHPAVLHLIKMTIDAAHACGKWVGLCGELAGDVLAVPLLLGLALDEFSMAAGSIPAVKSAVRQWTLPECQKIAAQALSLASATEVVAFLKDQTPR